MSSQDQKITYNAIQERALDDAKERMPDLPKLPERQLYADSSRGVHIPQHFAQSINRECVSGIDLADLDFLASALAYESDDFWDIWTDVLDSCVLTDSNGQQWRLHQDGDLWLVPVNAVDSWETFISDLEDLDAMEIAHESSEWDWVIYYHRALELCQAVPSDVLHDAESQWQVMGFNEGETFGLYEMAVQLAAIIVTDEIMQAVEHVREELLDMANNQLENM